MLPNPISVEELRRLAITDELTGLYNRRYFKIRLNEELERARRADRDLALLLLDLDGLKSVNDMYGHLRGDRLIADFAEVISGTVRPFDLVARFAGDEFIILLPESDQSTTETIANRIRTAVFEKIFSGDPDLRVTTSIGVSIFPMDGDDAETLISAADRGLYSAKRNGRNRISFAPKADPDQQPGAGLLETRIVGRDEELYLLGRILSDSLKGHSNCVFVAGEIGVGVSRLLDEFKRRARQVGALVLSNVCFEHSRFIPYHPVREAFRNLLNENSQLVYRALLNLNIIQRIELLRLLPELDPGRLEVSDAPRVPIDDEFQLYDAITQFIIQLAKPSAVVVILDDIHWMDDATSKLLIYILRAVSKRSFLFVGSFCQGDNPDSVESQPELKSWMRGLKEFSTNHFIQLHRLNRARSRELINAFLGESLPVEFTNLVHRESEGNPYFIEEILKSLISKKQLIRKKSGWKLENLTHLTAPDSIREVIFSRIENLDTEDRHILSICAIIGRIFDFETLQMVSGRNEGHLLDILERLEAAGLIIQRSSQEGEKFQFTHNKIQEVLYDQMKPRRRKQIHQWIARALERLYQGRTEYVAGELAYHYKEGRMIDQALTLYRKAGDKAASLHADSSALRYYLRAIRLIKKTPEKYVEELSVLYQKSAMLLKNQGNGLRAIQNFKRAIAVGGSFLTAFRHAQIHRWIAEIHLENGRYDAAAENIRAAESFLEPEMDKLELIRLEICKAGLMLKKGEYEACLELSRSYITDIQNAGLNLELSDLLDLNASAEYSIGNRDRAVRLYSESLELRRKEKDLSRISRSYLNIAGVLMEVSRWDDALEWYQKCLKIEKRLGHLVTLADPHEKIAQIYLWRGDLSDAGRHCRKCLKIREMSGDVPGLANANTIMMQIYLAYRELDKAQEFLEKAEKLHSEYAVGMPGQRVVFARALFELALGNYETADTVAQDILRIHQLFGDLSGKAATYLLLGIIAKKMGKYDLALDYLNHAEHLFTTLNNRYELGRAYKETALVLRRLEDWDSMQDYFLKAREIFQNIGSRVQLNQVIEAMAQTGNTEKK